MTDVSTSQAQSLRRALIAGDVLTQDQYAQITVSGSDSVHIGPQFGLDETRTAALVEASLRSIESEEIDRSLRAYFRGLKRYYDSSFRVLASRLTGPKALEQLYVPVYVTGSTDTDQPLLIADALRLAFKTSNKHVLVEGLPGSGKSSVLQQIARHAWDDPSSVGLDQPYIVLPLRLRCYAQSIEASRPDRIFSALSKAQDLEIPGARPPPGFFEEWPKRMGAPWLLLLDGFDEVPEKHLNNITQWLLSLIDENYATIVTCRSSQSLRQGLLRAMKLVSIRSFTAAQQLTLANNLIGIRGNEFINRFRAFSGGELGRTPLLLTLAAIVFENEGELPLSRGTLYRQFITDNWRDVLPRASEEEPDQDLLGLLPRALRRIALSMTESYGSDSSLDFTKHLEHLIGVTTELLEKDLGISRSLARVRAERVVTILGRHSRLFRIADGSMQWLHPTFREFLAAQALEEKVTGREHLSQVMHLFADSIWRDVLLFLLGLLSEKRSVTPELQMITEMEPHRGIPFAGIAISQGASVDGPFQDDVIEQLCKTVRENSSGWICTRLLSFRDDGKPAREAISALLSANRTSPRFARLKEDLISTAVEYNRKGACGLEDLKSLGAVDALHSLATHPLASAFVRADAARALCECGQIDSGVKHFKTLLAELKQGDEQWDYLARSICRPNKTQVIGDLAQFDRLSHLFWCRMIEEIFDEGHQEILDGLSADSRIPADRRITAQLCLEKSRDVVRQLIPAVIAQEDLIDLRLGLCKKTGASVALLELVASSIVPPTMRLRALRALKDRRPECKTIMANAEMPYALRRRAAEFLCNCDTDTDTARLLLQYFDSLAHLVNRPSILNRRAFLNYYLDQYAEAIALDDRVISLRPTWAAPIARRGHCLELMKRYDEALSAYSHAIEVNPEYSFSRVRRAYLLWVLDKWAEARSDVDVLTCRDSPEWFRKYAGDILRESEAPQEASEWLDAAVSGDPKSPQARTFRGLLSFQNGFFGRAIDDLKLAVGFDPSYYWGWRQLADVYRVTGWFREAADACTNLLGIRPDSTGGLYLRAEVLLCLGHSADAEVVADDIARAIQLNPKDSWGAYLSGYAMLRRGSEREFLTSTARAIELLPPASESSATQRSNRALYLLAVGQESAARAIYDDLYREREFKVLRTGAVPETAALFAGLPARKDIRGLHDYLATMMWPNGCGVAHGPDPRKELLLGIKRASYPFPMYCQLSSIQGLGEDCRLGANILYSERNNPRGEQRTLVIWTLGQPDRIFGYSNFRMDGEAEFDLKFCERLEQMLAENLKVLVLKYRVRRLLFLEPELLQKFQTIVERKHLPATWELLEIEAGQTYK